MRFARAWGKVGCAAVAALCLVLFFSPASGGSTGHHYVPKQRKVVVGSDFYDPPKVTINPRDRVKWTWEPGFSFHNVYVKKGPEDFHSPTQTAGTYTRVFRKPGTFRLYCTKHTMYMTLIVRKVPLVVK